MEYKCLYFIQYISELSKIVDIPNGNKLKCKIPVANIFFKVLGTVPTETRDFENLIKASIPFRTCSTEIHKDHR